MDPLNALSLAATVAQFIGFASELVRQSADIYRSTTGASQEVQNIDSVYSRL